MKKHYWAILGLVIIVIVVVIITKPWRTVMDKPIVSAAIFMGFVTLVGLWWHIKSAIGDSTQVNWGKALLDGISVLAAILIGVVGVKIALSLGEKEQQQRRFEMAPMLVFESLPVKYRIEGGELIFTICNSWKGTARNLAVGLEHKSRKGEGSWKKPLRWDKIYIWEEASPVAIEPGKTWDARIDLLSDFNFEFGDTLERDSLLTLNDFDTFNAFIVYTDVRGNQYMTEVLMEREDVQVKFMTPSEFWNNLDKCRQKVQRYYPYLHSDIKVFEFWER